MINTFTLTRDTELYSSRADYCMYTNFRPHFDDYSVDVYEPTETGDDEIGEMKYAYSTFLTLSEVKKLANAKHIKYEA